MIQLNIPSQASQEEFEDDWDEADISIKKVKNEEILPSQMILEVGIILEWLVYRGIFFWGVG